MIYCLGRIKHDDGTFSDRDYMSWSSLNLWKTNKNEYRRRYYLNEPSFENTATIFGKEVHKKFEEDESVVGSETSIKLVFHENLKLLGHLDSFDDQTLAIIDFKTGREPWTKFRVQKHGQLVFYSLLVELRHGKFNPNVELHWHETRFKNKSTEFDGHILETESRELELTGKVEVFKRRIYKWEVEKMKQEILLTAKAITEDYKQWQNTHKHQYIDTLKETEGQVS